ncbi:MAG: T9SS C-terminal target domain-containing protein [Saprospirales bacterium]|nr:MAG: T9SS C-terminal target domain-containing protein [Saprospirales bacterium]
MNRLFLCKFFPTVLLCFLPGVCFSQHESFNSELHFTDVIVVKFQDELQVDFSPNTKNVLNIDVFNQETLALFNQFEWIWPYHMDRKELSEKLINIPVSRSNIGRIPNITNRFNLRIKGDISVADALMEFRKIEGIEYAYPIPLPVDPALAPDFEVNQGYLNESPIGIDARFMWDSLYIRGNGMKIVDIEYNFNPNHLDLPEVGVLGGIPYDFFGDNHGTAVLGQLGALDNGWGVTGMVPDADLYFHYSFSEFNFLDIGSAVVNSAFLIEEGDVILIEAQTAGPLYDASAGNQFGLVPVEWFQPWYDDIVVAVAMGRVVVAAGGNGAQDLDDDIYLQSFHQPFTEANNSGSIIVGAGAAPAEFNGTSTPRSRLGFSNYGSRVNLQGWGQRIYTTGYGSAYNNGGKNLYFANGFSGTSGASPFVTAAAALLQAAYKNFYGGLLTGPEIFEILEITGLPQQSGGNPVSQNIGPLPDLRAAMEYLGIPPCKPFPDFSFTVDTMTCQSESRGMIQADSAFENQTAYFYSWNTGDTTLSLENMGSGFFELTVTDSAGCKKFFSFDLPVLDDIEIFTEVSGGICSGQQNGSIGIQIRTQLVDSIFLLLDGEAVSNRLENLPAGTFQLVATAGKNCSTSVVVEIPDGELIDFSLSGNPRIKVEESSFFSANNDFYEIYEWTAEHADFISGQGSSQVELRWDDPGVYRLGLTAGSENCQQSKWLKILVEEPVTTMDLSELISFNIYPNPATDKLKILIEEEIPDKNLRVQVYNMVGKLVYSAIHQTKDIQLDISSLPSAPYNLIIIQGQKVIGGKKILVQR